MEYVNRVVQGDTVDNQVGAEVFYFLWLGKAERIVEEAHALAVHFVYGRFMVEAQYIRKEASHLSCTQNQYFHAFLFIYYFHLLTNTLLVNGFVDASYEVGVHAAKRTLCPALVQDFVVSDGLHHSHIVLFLIDGDFA